MSHLSDDDPASYGAAMSRKLAGALVGFAVVALAVWFFAFRKHDDAKPAAPVAKTEHKDPWLEAKPKQEAEQTKPRGAAPKWTLDVDPEGPLRLEGQVVDGDGHGVGKAEVTLESVPPRTVTTEDDGTFVFDKLVGRTYELSASSGELVGTATYKLMAGGDPVVVRMGAGAAIEVTVNDEKGQPIANAQVNVPEPIKREGKTDDKGHATVKGVKPGWVSVEASAPGYATGNNFTSVGSAGATGKLAITLRKGAAVSGRVVDEAGAPLAKVRVIARDRDGWSRDRGEQTSNDKGEFTFPALAPGGHVLAATDGEHAPAESSPIPVKVDRAVTGVTITMKAGAVAAGVVVDGDGKPVSYATVRVSGKGGEAWRSTARQATTDQQGKFELRGLARHKMVARAESDLAASKLTDLDFTAKAAERELRLVLDVTGTISGVVVDDTGKPVPEVSVNAFPDLLSGEQMDGLMLAGMSAATTDGAGSFALHGLPDGSYRLSAARHSVSFDESWGKQSTPAKSGDKNVKITLGAPGTLVGRLALETGAAPKLGYIQVGQRPATPTTATGTFELGDLEPGPYDLHVFGPEFAEYVKHDIKIEPGKTTDVGTLTVVHGRKLVGKVVDNSGAPVAGAKIKLAEMLFSSANDTEQDSTESWEDLSGIRTTTSDQDGSFVLAGVPQKATTVQADQPDRGRSLATAVPEGLQDPPPITLVLHGYGSIVGKVTKKGEPLGNATISEATKGGVAQAAFAQTAADGTFEMAKVPEGTHVLTAMESGMMSMRATNVTVQVTAGQQAQANIDIPVGTITLAVTIKALPNNQVDAAQVFLLDGTQAITSAKQLMDGFFQTGVHGMKFWLGASKAPVEFDELTAGTYTLCAVPITGNMSDPTFMSRLDENKQTLKVYCKLAPVAASPNQQTVSQDLPAMTPLPQPKS
jgi:protocatechuate 3,4-dioxygenase beta subunit